jgi:hypothetical protein
VTQRDAKWRKVTQSDATSVFWAANSSNTMTQPSEPMVDWPSIMPDGIFSNPKISFWVNIGRSCNERCIFVAFLSVLRPNCIPIVWSFGIFCGHLVYFVVIWYIFGRKICLWLRHVIVIVAPPNSRGRCYKKWSIAFVPSSEKILSSIDFSRMHMYDTLRCF